MRRISRRAVSAFLAAALCITVCVAVATSSALAGERVSHASGPTGALTIDNEVGRTWSCSFNPYNSLATFNADGLVYESLDFVNTLKSGQTTPWLASAYSWSDHSRRLTFTIRRGVKWTDGTPLTAADVAFTFQLLKRDPGLDLNSIWSVLSSVVQKGDQVVFTFKTAALPYFYYVADQTWILPEHIWAHVKNPVTYLDANPVGTGPYTVKSCTPQNITYSASRHYWQPGLPKIATVYYPAFTSNTPANLTVETGQAQWGSQFIPNMKLAYLSKSPENHSWNPPTVNLSLFINQKVAPLNDVAVRRAMAYAINRKQVSTIGEYGEQPASNQTGVVLPTFSSWYDTSAAGKYNYGDEPSKAVSILEKDGYKRDSNGIFAKHGKELSFTVMTIGGNTDWISDLHVVESELAAVGIKLTTEGLSGTAFLSDLYRGQYQLGLNVESGGPTPYYELRQLLYSKNSAPIGQTAATNWERWEDPATDRLITSYASASSEAQQHEIVDKLEQVMLADVPVIPLSEFVDWYQYSTKEFTGWVTPSNPYAQPAIWIAPDDEVVLLHLKPK